MIEVEGPLLRDPGARRFYTSSSCGVCGKGALEEVAVARAPVEDGPTVARSLLAALPDRLRQPTFARTGGLHATGLFDSAGELSDACARTSAATTRWTRSSAARRSTGCSRSATRILCVSGRLSFELVQKAAVAGAPIMVAVGAPSSLAVELATDRNITLVGFARGGSANVYSNPIACSRRMSVFARSPHGYKQRSMHFQGHHFRTSAGRTITCPRRCLQSPFGDQAHDR